MGLFGATKPRIIRRASDAARHRCFRDGNCVVPELNSTSSVQLQLQKLSKTRVITVTQVRFDHLHPHFALDEVSTSGLFPYTVSSLYSTLHLSLQEKQHVENNCPGHAVLLTSYRMH